MKSFWFTQPITRVFVVVVVFKGGGGEGRERDSRQRETETHGEMKWLMFCYVVHSIKAAAATRIDEWAGLA